MPRINLKEALSARAARVKAPRDIPFSELVAAFAAMHFDGTDERLGKWVALFEGRSAWAVSGPEISAALSEMDARGYSPGP